MEKIVIVEDELIVARDLSKTLERNGYAIAGVATSVARALPLIEQAKPWLVLVDIFLKGNVTGIDLAIQLNKQGIAFIYVSANSNQAVLEAAKTTNPYGFIVKPFRERDLLVTIDIARYRYDNNKLMHSNATKPLPPVAAPVNTGHSLPAQATVKSSPPACEGIIGSSAPMQEVFSLIRQVAPVGTSVLLLGESGTGKEGVARCIFQQSKRSHKPFVKINCAAIPSSLMEAELFGYEKGAFTGATDRKAGKFEMANGGTMLLDEIGEMPLGMQVKLLRVLQEKEIQRIGSNATLAIDVRIIAATSKNLEKEVAEGRFRLDLYYRLHVFPITLPPLRERKEDIPALAAHFIGLLSTKSGKNVAAIANTELQKMMRYHWPGNVRELEHLVERSILMATGATITSMPLPAMGSYATPAAPTGIPTHSLQQHEREHILAALKKSNGKIRGEGGAAALLGIPSTTLHSKMKKLGITKNHG